MHTIRWTFHVRRKRRPNERGLLSTLGAQSAHRCHSIYLCDDDGYNSYIQFRGIERCTRHQNEDHRNEQKNFEHKSQLKYEQHRAQTISLPPAVSFISYNTRQIYSVRKQETCTRRNSFFMLCLFSSDYFSASHFRHRLHLLLFTIFICIFALVRV